MGTGAKEKPVGKNAGWKFIESRTRFQNEIFRVREDEVDLVGGKRIQYAYAERPAAVVIVPVTSDGRMVLVKQYRYAVDDWCLEVPAGGTHDTGQTPLEEVARKELREEIGATARSLSHVGFFYTAPALSDEKCHVFLAEGVEISEERDHEATETIETEIVSVAKALDLARSGAMKTAPCALAVLLCEPRLTLSAQHHPTPDRLLET